MKFAVALILLFLPLVASAQTAIVDRVRLESGPCIVTSQAGPPIQLVLEGNCAGITTSAATNLTLNPTGDLVTDPVGNDILPELNYDINIGMLSKKYLTLHAAELWVETLVAQNTIATIGGRVLVAPTNILTIDLNAGDTIVSVKYNNLVIGDRIYMEADGKLEFMAVTAGPSGAGPYTYNLTRDLDGSGSNQWYAGDAILNTGTTGNGFIDIYSTAGILSTGSGPTIVGNVRTGTAYNSYAPRWAIGNLNGLYGYGVTTYGTVFGDPTATNVTIDATNGFRIRSGTTNKLVADTAGNLSIVGDLSVGTSGVIRSGATGFTTGTGYWLEYNAGTPRFRIGNPAGSRLVFDGTTVSVVGVDGAGITNISGSNIQTGTVTATQIAASTITAAQIAAATITATQIAASTITAAKLNVSTLSAITANLGSITAGTITGVTATFGGSVTLNSSGVTVDAGLGSGDGYKFESAGIGMFYDTSVNVIYSKSSGGFNWERTGASLAYTSLGFVENNGANLGTSGNRWGKLWATTIDITGNAQMDSDLLVDGVIYSTNLAGSGRRYLCIENNGAITADNVAC